MLTPVQAEAREIFVGQALKVEAEIRVDGEPKDPTALYLKIKTPSGAITTLDKAALSSDEVGFWYSVPIMTEAGWWWFRFEASGVADGVNEMPVYVKPSNI